MSTNRVTDCSLLLIDDEEANLDLLEGLLLADGYVGIHRVCDAREAISAFQECDPDLVLLDLHMPHRTGYEILADITRIVGESDYLPVLVLTADVTSEARDRALSHGARDFVTKPFDTLEVSLRVRNLLETRLLHRAEREARLRAEQAERRARLLADASRVLGASLDSDTVLAQLARLLVPEFADPVDFLVRTDGEFRMVRGAGESDSRSTPPSHLDPSAEPLASALLQRAPMRVRLHDDERDFVVAPMATSEGVAGAIVLTPPARKGGLSAADIDVLGDLAGRTALALENARLFADAQIATRARERLLSVVAHDLRNPLAVISMYAEMLLDLMPEDGDPYAADALNSIYISSHRMQEQIESLLDLSRLQQGTFSITAAETPLRGVFEEAEMLLRPLAETRGIELRIERQGDPEIERFDLDASRFQQVLSNLVGNAIKFTPEGGEVSLRWTVGREELRVSVVDTGPGIPAEQLPHLFGAYWQSRQGDRRGIGLGLWISKAIVEAHGGRIWVDSPPGSGATFHLTIPLPSSSERQSGHAGEMGRMTHDPTTLAG